MEKLELKDKSYLGDGVYVGHDGYQIWVTTEDGISITNAVALDVSVWASLIKYQKNLMEKLNKGTGPE